MKNILRAGVLLTITVLHYAAVAQVILDADGKPLPKEVAALIGRKFQALPVDPKLGDKSPIRPNLGVWRPVELEGTEAQIMRSKQRPNPFREHYKRHLKELRQEHHSDYLQGKILCAFSAGHGWKNSKYVVKATYKYCTDESFEILDAIILPKNFGVTDTYQVMPKESPQAEFKRRKELGLLKNPGFAFLPSRFFKVSYCPYYLVFAIAVDANRGQAYEYDLKTGKYVRSNDPEMMANNPNPFCGAAT